MLDPLTPKSDQHLISPNAVTPESHIQGHESKGNNHQLKKPLMVEQILFVSSIGDVWKQCGEYPYDTNSFLFFFFCVFWLIVVSNDLNA